MIDFQKLKSQFLISPEITYLNFGSFGSCPKPVFDDYQKWQLLLETEPAQFIAVNGVEYLKKSREALAQFVHCQPDDLVYVTNPTYAVNIIAKSFGLSEGDEILATNIEYGSLDRTWNYYCRKSKAKYIRQKIELPVRSKEEIIEQFWKGYSKKAKAIFISQITSSTALILPVKEICEMAKERGLITIVDGAHVPGHIPLDLTELKADIYTGACHKWMMAPKGSSFLYVAKEYQHLFDPLSISWGYESTMPSNSQFLDYHQMQGTRDFSAFLAVPKAIEFMQTNEWESVRRRCRDLAHANYMRFSNLLGTNPICPINDEYLGQMCSIPIRTTEPEKLQRYIFENYKIEVPVMRQEERVFIRYSIQAYNSINDLDKLFKALDEIIKTTNLIQCV